MTEIGPVFALRSKPVTTMTESQMLLIRVILGLRPIHDVVECIRVLHDDGREAFERLRGPRADDESASWRPLERVAPPQGIAVE